MWLSTASPQAPPLSRYVSGVYRGQGGMCLGQSARHPVCLIVMNPLGTQEGVRITLDCAQAAFISYDKMVISLKGGEM